MPVYEFICDECGERREIICSMSDIVGKEVYCSCISKNGILMDGPPPVLMRRIYSNGGVVFKGTGWPSQKFKRMSEDQGIKEMRRKACVLKDRGDVPQEHVIPIGNEAIDRYDKKYADKDLDKLYDDSLKHAPKAEE